MGQGQACCVQDRSEERREPRANCGGCEYKEGQVLDGNVDGLCDEMHAMHAMADNMLSEMARLRQDNTKLRMACSGLEVENSQLRGQSNAYFPGAISRGAANSSEAHATTLHCRMAGDLSQSDCKTPAARELVSDSPEDILREVQEADIIERHYKQLEEHRRRLEESSGQVGDPEEGPPLSHAGFPPPVHHRRPTSALIAAPTQRASKVMMVAPPSPDRKLASQADGTGTPSSAVATPVVGGAVSRDQRPNFQIYTPPAGTRSAPSSMPAALGVPKLPSSTIIRPAAQAG